MLDAMGGDAAPRTPVEGALRALAADGGFAIVLVGDESRVRPILAGRSFPQDRLTIRHAPEVVGMEESPSTALRRKRESSIAVGLDMQSRGEADAFVSAGNTGAVMAAALTTLGRIEGISRPAIVTLWPTQDLPCVVLDVGANADCKPQHLFQFALMGQTYARDVLGREWPRVGLLSIGEEPSKGNELTIRTHALLAGSDRLNFVGNVEGRDVLRGAVDVVVCDGFTGNVLLKFGESLVDFLTGAVRREARASLRARLGALLMRSAFASMRRRLDYAEQGGAPLLGVDGIVIICHGSSSGKAIHNAIRAADRSVERDLRRRIAQTVRDRGAAGPAAPGAGGKVAR